MESNPDNTEPLQEKPIDELATGEDRLVAGIIVDSLLETAPYRTTLEYSYFDEATRLHSSFKAVDTVENGVPYNTAEISIFRTQRDDNPVIFLEYDESNSLLTRKADRSRPLAENARMAEDMINAVFEREWSYLYDDEAAIFKNLLLQLKELQDRREPVGSLDLLPGASLTDTIRAVARAKSMIPVKNTFTRGEIGDGGIIQISGFEYLSKDVWRDFDPGKYIKKQVVVRLPSSGTLCAFMEFYDGTIHYEDYYQGRDSGEVDDEVDETDDERRMPTRAQIEVIIDSMIEFGLDEMV